MSEILIWWHFYEMYVFLIKKITSSAQNVGHVPARIKKSTKRKCTDIIKIKEICKFKWI